MKKSMRAGIFLISLSIATSVLAETAGKGGYLSCQALLLDAETEFDLEREFCLEKKSMGVGLFPAIGRWKIENALQEILSEFDLDIHVKVDQNVQPDILHLYTFLNPKGTMLDFVTNSKIPEVKPGEFQFKSSQVPLSVTSHWLHFTETFTIKELKEVSVVQAVGGASRTVSDAFYSDPVDVATFDLNFKFETDSLKLELTWIPVQFEWPPIKHYQPYLEYPNGRAVFVAGGYWWTPGRREQKEGGIYPKITRGNRLTMEDLRLSRSDK